MGLMDKMMELMIGKLNKEEKEEIEKFFADFEKEDMQNCCREMFEWMEKEFSKQKQEG